MFILSSYDNDTKISSVNTFRSNKTGTVSYCYKWLLPQARTVISVIKYRILNYTHCKCINILLLEIHQNIFIGNI